MLEAIRYVDLVIPEENWEQKATDVKEYHVDTFVIGDDWKGKFDFLKESCEVVYLERTPEISTTQIKSSGVIRVSEISCQIFAINTFLSKINLIYKA